jgi:hypothetical protein
VSGRGELKKKNERRGRKRTSTVEETAALPES